MITMTVVRAPWRAAVNLPLSPPLRAYHSCSCQRPLVPRMLSLTRSAPPQYGRWGQQCRCGHGLDPIPAPGPGVPATPCLSSPHQCPDTDCCIPATGAGDPTADPWGAFSSQNPAWTPPRSPKRGQCSCLACSDPEDMSLETLYAKVKTLCSRPSSLTASCGSPVCWG